jgi:hypothetical protein
MGLVALFLIPVAMFFFGAFMFTLLTLPKMIICLSKHQYIRASLWICAGIFMLNWWDGKHGWEELIPFYLACVGAGVIASGWRYSKRPTQPLVQPWTSPPTFDGNVIPFVKATKEERERMMRIQGHRCANPYCNMDLRESIPHWDHIKPRSKGGTDSVHNMQWLCDTCNLNKKDMDWLEFLFRYSTSMGIDPNQNQEPWKRWVLTRAKNQLQG